VSITLGGSVADRREEDRLILRRVRMVRRRVDGATACMDE
jgi:hypothetical protein